MKLDDLRPLPTAETVNVGRVDVALNDWRTWASGLLRSHRLLPRVCTDSDLQQRIATLVHQLNDNLTATQERCTQLLEENRKLKGNAAP